MAYPVIFLHLVKGGRKSVKTKNSGLKAGFFGAWRSWPDIISQLFIARVSCHTLL
jgi:hypothetical protein